MSFSPFDDLANLVSSSMKTIMDQGGPSVGYYPGDSLTKSLYRNLDNGRKCAIGAIMPDSIYKPEFEGHNYFGLIRDYKLRLFQCGDPQMTLKYDGIIWRMQMAHDDASTIGIGVFPSNGKESRITTDEEFWPRWAEKLSPVLFQSNLISYATVRDQCMRLGDKLS